MITPSRSKAREYVVNTNTKAQTIYKLSDIFFQFFVKN